MARAKKKAGKRAGRKRNPQWTGSAGTEASWLGRALGHQKWPDSDYPYDVPGQVAGKYNGYLFRVYQRPRGVGYVKEVWDWKDRYHFILPYAPTKAQAVHEVKQRIDLYIAEGSGPRRNPPDKFLAGRWKAASDAELREEISDLREFIREDKAALKKMSGRRLTREELVHAEPERLKEDIAEREGDIRAIQGILESRKAGRAAIREAAKPKPMQHVVVRRRGGERPKSNPLTHSISGGEFDALRTGQRVWITVSTVMGSGGEMEFEVGKSTYSKKYDVHNKRLFPVHAGKPQKTGAKWTLRKRASGLVSLAHGDMGTLIKGYRTNPGRTTKSVRVKVFNPRKIKRGRKPVRVSLRSVMGKALK